MARLKRKAMANKIAVNLIFLYASFLFSVFIHILKI